MTGDRPVIDSAPSVAPATPVSLTEEPAAQLESPVAAAPPPVVPPVAPAAPREVQFLEKAPVEKMDVEPAPPPERSKFLDLSEPEAEPHPRSGTSTIVGPSFLGLSDPPAAPVVIEEPPAPPRSQWRAWTAAVVVLLFAGLGYLEWRSEKNQTNNGPIDVMKMQIQRLKGKKGAVVSPESTPETTQESPSGSQPTGTGNGPDMQVVPQQKPQTPTNTAPANGTSPAPAANQPAQSPGSAVNNPTAPAPAVSQQATPGPARGGGVETADLGRNPPQPTNTNAPAAGKAAASAGSSTTPNTGIAGADDGAARETVRAPKPVPGADELAKAENASDAAAASAWLWKSVAKGNPEAPVRLANMYIKGDGVAKSCEQALVLLKSAAAKENAGARSRLGSLYGTGTCVPRDRVRAFEYMNSALDVNPNATWARDFREQLWNQMTPQERTQAERSR